MKKNIHLLSLLIVALFVFQNTVAQLYVSPNSYMYVADNYVYVKQDINLQNNGNVYLRNESQLLQGTSGSSTNQGAGKLSVFQEGTVNNYAYNYWCSPVGNASSASNPFGVSMLNRATGLTNSTPATLITSLDGSTSNSNLSIASRWVFKFLSSSAYSQWISVGSASTINAGEGFTMKGSNGTDNTTVLDGRNAFGMPTGTGIQNNPTGFKQRYDFRGLPNDGDINISLGANKLTLTGNPYPSAINLNMFILDNVASGAIDGTVYFWEQDANVNSHVLVAYRGGYGTYLPSDPFTEGLYAAATWTSYNGDGSVNVIPPGPGAGGTYFRMISPIGQGFMVLGSATTTGTAVMKNSYRVFKKEGVANNSQFARKIKDDEFWEETPNIAGIDYTKYRKRGLPHIKIHTMLNNEFTKEMVVAFNTNATDGYDLGKDAKSPLNNLANDTYFPLDGKNEYVISTLPFDIEKRIPIALKCNSRASFKITVGSLINFDLAENIFIYDKLTGTYHDIKNGYYDVTIDSESKDRFEITFKNPSLTTADAEVLKSFTVFQNNESNELVISNTQLINMKSCYVYDILGKVIFSKEKLGSNSQYVFPTNSYSDGVYIVKLKTSNNLEVSKKVIVKKK